MVKKNKNEIKFLNELRRELKRRAKPKPTWLGWGHIDMIILKRLELIKRRKE